MTAAQAVISLLETAYNNLDVEQLLDLYHEDVRLTDHLFGITDADKPTIRALYTEVFRSSDDIQLATRCISGVPDLIAWESDKKGRAKQDLPGLGIRKGEAYVLRGVSLTSWREGRIVEEKNYFYVLR